MPYDRAEALLIEREMVEALNNNSIDRRNMKMEMAKIAALTQKPPLDTMGIPILAADLDRIYDDVKAKIQALMNVTPGSGPGP